MTSIALNTNTKANKIGAKRIRVMSNISTAKLVVKEVSKFVYRALRDADLTMYM